MQTEAFMVLVSPRWYHSQDQGIYRRRCSISSSMQSKADLLGEPSVQSLLFFPIFPGRWPLGRSCVVICCIVCSYLEPNFLDFKVTKDMIGYSPNPIPSLKFTISLS